MSVNDFPRPPAHLEPFVCILGVDKAVEFLLAFGGSEFSFRENPRPGTPVVQMIGREAVIALAAEGLPARIPTGKPWIAQVLRAKGLSVAAIARKLHTSDVTVRRWVKQPGSTSPALDTRQLRLF